mgnify:CR=1 FL=1
MPIGSITAKSTMNALKNSTELKEAKKSGTYLNAGESICHPYWDLEKRCGDLYGLFAVDAPETPGLEAAYRVYYQK